ncbi:hypothetical protein [Ruegeria sp. Alg231-54]|uniref:hypothetical protein n=1 Tax=Ruegeria sp. Alg231-54 TaxID=1922221 RepID=UPI000D55CE39|nr:hypothetical protein [Ruegeria sp. Alg231-54]
MRKRFFLGLVFLIILTSPVWFFVLRNEAIAFQLKAELGNASLPDGAEVISLSSRVYNSGNSDGCDFQAIAVVKYFGKVDALHSTYMDLIGTMSDEEPYLGQNDNPARWGAKLTDLFTEISITPNMDNATHYLVSATTYARDVSPDFRCWLTLLIHRRTDAYGTKT